jgi:hypothetical protein
VFWIISIFCRPANLSLGKASLYARMIVLTQFISRSSCQGTQRRRSVEGACNGTQHARCSPYWFCLCSEELERALSRTSGRNEWGLKSQQFGVVPRSASQVFSMGFGSNANSAGSCPKAWCSRRLGVGVFSGVGRVGQITMAGIRLWDHRSKRPWFPGSCSERAGRPIRHFAPTRWLRRA